MANMSHAYFVTFQAVGWGARPGVPGRKVVPLMAKMMPVADAEDTCDCFGSVTLKVNCQLCRDAEEPITSADPETPIATTPQGQ